jgi:hypothetical protein
MVSFKLLGKDVIGLIPLVRQVYFKNNLSAFLQILQKVFLALLIPLEQRVVVSLNL